MKTLHLQQIYKETVRILFRISATLLLLLIGVSAVATWSLLQSKGRVSCADFDSYADAVDALPNAPWLDANHNGKPCESFFNKSHN